MKGTIVFILAAFIASSSATEKAFEQLPTFEEWIKQHHKPWKSGTAEFDQRKTIFESRLKEIIQHNANPNKSYKKGVNQFSASTLSELKSSAGAVPEMLLSHDPKHRKKHDVTLTDVSSLPKSVDWREKGVISPVKNQGHCGSCWAFSTTESIESHVAINTGVLFSMSPQQVASCTENPEQCGGTGGCEGGMPQVAFDSIANKQGGITESFQYPYASFYGEDFACKAFDGESTSPTSVATIDGFIQVTPNNYTELMNTVAKVGPVSIVLDASTFHTYAEGIFDGCDPENIELDHAVQLVGYGEEEDGQKWWLVRNSWSPSWGEKGYIRVKRSDNDDNVCDLTGNAGRCKGEKLQTQACGTCGIMYSPSYPVGGKLEDGDHPDDP